MPFGLSKATIFGAAGGSSALGYILLYGDPDNAGGVNAETYPYNIQKLSNGTTVRIGGRFGTSASESSRMASGEIDLSGGYGTAPTSLNNQLAWSWRAGSTYNTITNAAGAMWVDGSDNLYDCGKSYNASYGYNNSMFTKFNSSQVNQWNQSWNTVNTYPYGVQDPQIIKTDGSNPKVVGFMKTSNYRAGAYKGRCQVQPMSDSDGGGIAGQKLVYPNNDSSYSSQINGSCVVSKQTYNDYFATAMPYYNSYSYQLPAIMLWQAESGNVQNQYGYNVAALRNQSTGASGNGDCYASGITIDSSYNTYLLCHGNSSKHSGMSGSGYLENVIIAKYNSSGTLQWAYALRQQTGGANSGQGSNMYPGGIVCDNGDDLYISGYSMGEDGNQNNSPFIARIDVSGATPSLTWINQACSSSYACYAQNVERIGTDQVVAFGYGQTDPSSNVVGVMPSMNIDGSTVGTADVDGITWNVLDLSSKIIFQDATTSTENVNFTNWTGGVLVSSSSTEASDSQGTISAFTSGAPSVTLTVESGDVA